MEKKYPWGKSKICVYVFLRYIKNVNLSFKKDFKFAEVLTKTLFSFTLETVLKIAKEANWGNVESIYAKVTKPSLKMVAKAEVNLNWLWTIEQIMDYFDCVYPRTI